MILVHLPIYLDLLLLPSETEILHIFLKFILKYFIFVSDFENRITLTFPFQLFTVDATAFNTGCYSLYLHRCFMISMMLYHSLFFSLFPRVP
jgi:hypothetical protein